LYPKRSTNCSPLFAPFHFRCLRPLVVRSVERGNFAHFHSIWMSWKFHVPHCPNGMEEYFLTTMS